MPSPIESAGQITNTDLLAGLTDRDVFDKLYIDTINHAIDMYVKGARWMFALKLHGSLTALDLWEIPYFIIIGHFTNLTPC
jgi:trafficking protein particle complex subunit 10